MLVTVISWNVNNRRGVADAVARLVGDESDMVLISLQEHFDLYSDVVRSVLKMHPLYKVVSVSRVLGLWSIVLSRRRCAADVMRIGLGPLGFINKGACMTRLSNGVMFVSCHLSAHQGNNARRLEEARKIFECICSSEALGSVDTVVLAGDMNFRTAEGTGGLEYSQASQYDQCNEFKEAYPMFQEAEIGFGPTYKYILGTDELSTERSPSWCDRVLVSSSYTSRFCTYDSAHGVRISDHKPVVCMLRIGGKKTGRVTVPMVGYNAHLVLRGLTRVICAIHEYCDAIAVCLLVLGLCLALARYKATISRLEGPRSSSCLEADC